MNDLFYSDLELIMKDEKQYEAFQSMDNTVVIAGPGSGKTRVLALKALTLVKTQIKKPCGLACISYSRESVRELKKRLKSYGYIPNNRDFIGTVHSFSLLHVIQPFAHLYPQYEIPLPIKILPDDIERQIYNGILKDLKITDSRQLPLSEINRYRSLSLIGRSTVQIESTDKIKEASKLFQERLNKTEFIDFIDIINLSARIINEQEYVSQSLQCRFPWLLIDEYQDLGKALHEMVLELAFNAGIKLYVVGDVNQSIYGFNGGYPEFLKELTNYDDIETISLVKNYRSSQYIIEASLETLQPTPPFPEYVSGINSDTVADFTFITCAEEMDEQYNIVASKIIPNLISKGVSLNDIGIITGSNNQIHEMAFHLVEKKIPYFIAKWSFENSDVVVWLQDCALWSCKKGQKSFDDLFKFWKNIIHSHSDPRKNWEDIRLKSKFHEVLLKCIDNRDCHDWLNKIISSLGITDLLEGSEIYPNEVENLNTLLNEAKFKNLKGATIERLAKLGAPENEVTISTRHSSKGLEFEVVILLGMEEEHFPNYYHLGNEMALAEDQRLCYVCVSRAKKACILLRSRIFTIQTRRGPWRKEYKASRYWNSLFKRFGNEQNTFTKDTYPLIQDN